MLGVLLWVGFGYDNGNELCGIDVHVLKSES